MTDGPGRVSTDTVDGAVGVDGYGGRGGLGFTIVGGEELEQIRLWRTVGNV